MHVRTIVDSEGTHHKHCMIQKMTDQPLLSTETTLGLILAFRLGFGFPLKYIMFMNRARTAYMCVQLSQLVSIVKIGTVFLLQLANMPVRCNRRIKYYVLVYHQPHSATVTCVQTIRGAVLYLRLSLMANVSNEKY